MSVKFSIIVPMYNVERYIEECIESVLKQTYDNLELLLVDDESTDGSIQIAQKYATADSRVKIIKKRHGGLPQTRNYGLRVARGEYIVLLDGDDYFALDHLEKAVNILEKYKCEMCIANNHINFTKDSKNRIELFPYDDKMNSFSLEECIQVIFDTKNKLPAAAVLTIYLRSFLEKNNFYYTEKYTCSEDLDMFLQCISKVTNIKFMGHEFYYYRQDNSQAMTKNMTADMYLSRMTIYEKWFLYYRNAANYQNYNKQINKVICTDFRKNVEAVFIEHTNYNELSRYIEETHYIWGKYHVYLWDYINLYLEKMAGQFVCVIRLGKRVIRKILLTFFPSLCKLKRRIK